MTLASHRKEAEKNKQRAMASESGGVERLKFEEAPASYKSPVCDHFGFAVEYNDEEVKTVNRNVCLQTLLETCPIRKRKHEQYEHASPA